MPKAAIEDEKRTAKRGRGRRRRRQRIFKPFRRASRPGAVPGTIKPSPDAQLPVIDAICITPEDVVERQAISPREVEALRGEVDQLWVDVDGLGDATTIREIGELFGLHPLALEDVVNVHQRAKVEVFDDHLFIVTRMVSIDGERIDSEQVSLFVGADFVVTFQERVGDCLEPIRRRVRNPASRHRQLGADYLAYTMLDRIIDAYFPVVEFYGNQLEQIEEQLEAGDGPGTINQLHKIRSDLLLLRRIIWPHREMFSSLLREESRLIRRETRLFLRDCYDHTVQVLDVTETYREICADLRELHYAKVGQRTNDVMRVLTMIATVFMPLSFLAGVYGMNFDPAASPWNMPELGMRYGYPAVLVMMALVAGGMLGFFWRKGWLSRRREL